MSDEAKPKKKKGGKKGKIVMMAGAVAILASGGAAGGYFVAGGFHAKEGPKEDFNRPQLVLEGENPEEIATTFAAKAKE